MYAEGDSSQSRRPIVTAICPIYYYFPAGLAPRRPPAVAADARLADGFPGHRILDHIGARGPAARRPGTCQVKWDTGFCCYLSGLLGRMLRNVAVSDRLVDPGRYGQGRCLGNAIAFRC
jgi:hypothetical protein